VPDVTDREIQEALWHYYYDVGQTVTYVLEMRMKKAGGSKKEKKKKKGGLAISLSGTGIWQLEASERLGATVPRRERITRWVIYYF
jgi:hypothetical protein